MLSITSHIQ